MYQGKKYGVPAYTNTSLIFPHFSYKYAPFWEKSSRKFGDRVLCRKKIEIKSEGKLEKVEKFWKNSLRIFFLKKKILFSLYSLSYTKKYLLFFYLVNILWVRSWDWFSSLITKPIPPFYFVIIFPYTKIIIISFLYFVVQMVALFHYVVVYFVLLLTPCF